MEGKAEAKGLGGQADGVWASCGREYVWFVAVTPEQGWVHNRYSVDGELRKVQDLGGIWDA